MWKSLSIKSQLILVLLLPISGLIYMTISNIKTSLDDYKNIDSSTEKIKNIAVLSRGISEISFERGYYNYSYFDVTKKERYKEEKKKTIDWFLKTQIKDTIISKNLKALLTSLKELQSNIENEKETPATAYVKYSAFNKILNNLIKREIIECESSKLSELVNNYYNYVILKESALLERGTVLQKLINSQNHQGLDYSLLELYFNGKDYVGDANFTLTNFTFDNLNKDLNKFRNSNVFKSHNIDSEMIIGDKLNLSPHLWWEKSSSIISTLTELEGNNLESVLNYTNKEKQSALKSIIILFSIMTLFLIITFFLLYKLVNNLSKSLNFISTTIKKISQGKIIGNPVFSGNSEFVDISNSFNQLLQGMKEQFELSSKISSGNYGSQINLRSPNDTLNKSLNSMSLELSRLYNESVEINEMRKNIFEINQSILDSTDLHEFGMNICQTLVKITQGCQANFYFINKTDNPDQLYKIGGYADDVNTPNVIKIGDGLVGEAVKSNQQKCLNNLPNEYSYISSSLGKSPYFNVLITPISYKNNVIGVIEIGSLENFSAGHEKLMSTVSDSIGNAIEVYIRNEELKISVNEINQKNNTLQVQEEELRQSNDELNKHTMLLQQSEEELRNQAAELEKTNAYLEEKGRELENKNYEIGIKNDELVIAQEELNIKADEIAQGSKYKSEFLANMSHELRTPLNSILILSDLLKENSGGNLSDGQIDNLSVINSSGKDLLNLITDILDISKIEAGKVEIYPEETIVERVFSDMDGLFRAQMEKKKIDFSTTVSEDCPRKLNTDIGKLEQILKNFLSNALKFTPEKGKVSLSFSSGKEKKDFVSPFLNKLKSDEIVCIQIKDNGIGISDINKKKLFQTFQQADSSTSRKYGGTGLGLFISKELAILLGGEVDFNSELNKGSVFSVYIPAIYQIESLKQNESIVDRKVETKQDETIKPSVDTIDLTEHLDDDRKLLSPDDKTILIIEDDAAFAEILMKVAHENGFKAVVAYQGETGYQYAKKYKPKAIILDMKLPGIDGWTVLKWLKEDKELKHIPVHVMSGMDREKLAKEMGAFGFLVKPITTEKLKNAFDSIDVQINKVFKKVLILEDDVNLNYSIKELIHNCDRNVICIQAHTFKEAEHILKNDDIDCAIMDIGLPDSKNIENISELRKISKNKDINIIVNTGKELTEEEELVLQNSANGVVIKTNNVTERLKDELLLFLDTVETTDKKTSIATHNLLGGDILKDKKILIVDDDIRNIYALSSALTAKGASITTAFNGIEALEVLSKNTDIDIVLMDIMMPEMDGFEATRKIRENAKWKNLPIIALTAKAMKGDREEILNAGASDYQSKPIDIQQLISLISIWIYK
ncbi:response regulator [Flavobacterium sp. K5-23]|uniref:response regulator n=1 Tax=Flavobacterium sp. K5-23 TaxID=2746225 RepID=UPI00200F6E11|nr:response regulator [Flavobacterium sp. K5-23]UQD56941.1 response regulator [Flavobacterium sp. K5-23]